MANESIQKLEELMRTDKDVQAKIKAAVEAYDGDKTDEQAIFEATVGKVGEELGFSISYEEARAYATKLVALDDGEIDAVAGGSVCWFIGASRTTDDEDAYCAYVGITIDDTW